MSAIYKLSFETVPHRFFVAAMAVLLFTTIIFAYTPLAHATTYGPYALQNNGSGRCMDVRGASTSNGAVVQVYDCLYTANQNFLFNTTDTAGVYTISPTHTTGKCLDITGASTLGGAQLQQYTCNGQANQKFLLFYTYGNIASIQPQHVFGKCLTPTSYFNMAPVVQNTCGGSWDQEWIFL